jgi:uncharacterized protein (AIM24 family)
VPYARAAVGANVAVTPLYVTVPATAPPGPETVKVELEIVAAFIASLKVALRARPIGTFVAAFTGTLAVTVGGGVIVVKVQT